MTPSRSNGARLGTVGYRVSQALGTTRRAEPLLDAASRILEPLEAREPDGREERAKMARKIARAAFANVL
jgi:hypothetical protein